MSRRQLPVSHSKYIAGSPCTLMSAERALTFFACINMQDLKSVGFSLLFSPGLWKEAGCARGEMLSRAAGLGLDCILFSEPLHHGDFLTEKGKKMHAQHEFRDTVRLHLLKGSSCLFSTFQSQGVRSQCSFPSCLSFCCQHFWQL